MSKELFPESDEKFARSAESFARSVGRDAAKFHVSPEDARAIGEAVDAYLLAWRHHTDRYNRSMKTRIAKDRARADAERVMRAAANLIRANRNIPDGTKEVLRIKVRPTKLRKRRCPQKPPKLEFDRVAGGTRHRAGTHVIRFGDGKYDLTRPGRLPGAERLELFVDLVPPGEPIPAWPGERLGGRMWFLGSFTRSPLRVEYPKAEQPMVVVYWARWGAGNNDVGPFSETLVTRIEGRDLTLIESPIPMERRKQQTIIITSGHRALPQIIKPITIEGAEVDERRLLTDETAEAA